MNLFYKLCLVVCIVLLLLLPSSSNQAKDFKFQRFEDDKIVHISDYEKPLVINFWAVW